MPVIHAVIPYLRHHIVCRHGEGEERRERREESEKSVRGFMTVPMMDSRLAITAFSVQRSDRPRGQSL